MNLTRRTFVAAGAAGLSGLLRAAPLGMPIGTQTYPVRDALLKDFPGTLKQIAALGYKSIEMCSPPGYGWKPLMAMSGAELKKTIHDAGLTCESSHYNFSELKTNLADRIAYAKELGLKQMIVSTFNVPTTAGLAEWAKAADEMNTIAAGVQKAGLECGFHNHNFEFREIDGVLIYDHLMSKLDPKLVKMQFQVAVINAGYEAAKFMRKYPGRFISLHLADWSATEKKGVPVGSGVVDWKDLFAAAKTGGVKNYFVEMNMDAMGPSIEYLKKLS